jgi:hypothetical protein
MADEKKAGSTRQKTPGVRVGRARKTGDIDALKRIHWLALRTAYRLMKSEGVTLFDQLSAVLAINQASGSFSKPLEQTDLKNELEAQRKELAELRQSSTYGWDGFLPDET